MKLSVENIVKINAYVGSLFIFLLIFKEVSLAYSFIFIALYALSAYKDFKKPLNINRTFINITGILFVILMVLRINPDNIVQPSVETLLVLLGLKLLEEKAFRDYMQIYLLIILLFAGYTILSTSMIFLLYLLILIFFINASVILLTYYQQNKEIELDISVIKRILIKTAIIPLLSIPFMIFLFFTLPRSNYPFLNFLQGQGKASTGFSQDVKLGDVSNIQEDDSVVMRVSGENIGEIYLRGLTWNYFDGKQWMSKDLFSAVKARRLFGKKYEYTVYLEPHSDIYLFTVEYPYAISQISGYFITPRMDKTYVVDKPIFNKIKYSGISFINDRYYEELKSTDEYLQLPKLNESIIKLAKDLNGNDEEETAKNIEKFLKSYTYSLQNLSVSQDPIYDFLFVKKQGNCEYFASSMVILLRLNGIPARLVGGYKTATYNQTANYYIVKQKDVHVWAEAYINKHWIRFDPTPAARNAIIEREKKLNKFKLWLDTINYYYTTFIVNYDFSKQVELFNKVKKSFSNIRDSKKIEFNFNKNYLIFTIILLLAGYLIFLSIKYLKQPYEKRLLNILNKRLKKYGYERKGNEGLEEFISRVENAELKQKLLTFARELESYVYKDKKLSKADYERLKKMIEKL